jgi:hypothetical protein
MTDIQTTENSQEEAELIPEVLVEVVQKKSPVPQKPHSKFAQYNSFNKFGGRGGYNGA